MFALSSGFYFLVFVTFVFGEPKVNFEPKIVGGSTAAPGAYPYQVSIRKHNSHFCGGSIISSFWILSAAHCVYGDTPQGVTVVVGTNSLSAGGTAYTVVQTIYHNEYNPQTVENDVAVLRVSSQITLAKSIINVLGKTVRIGPPVTTIALSSENPPADSKVVLTGWGLTSYPGSIPNDLQEIELTVMDLNTCAQSLHGTNPIRTGNVCTTSSRGFGPCQGDSGGPLVSNVTGLQVGIVSWGIPCAKGLPDVFSSVAFHLSWIQANAN